MESKTKVILFDMGRVLITIDFDAFPNALGLTTREQRAPYTSAAMKLEHLYECGKLTTEEFLDALYPLFERKFSREVLLDAYNRIIVEENSEIVPLVKKVKEQYRIALLSNTSDSHWKKSLSIAPVLSLFSERYTSFQLGAMKPEKGVYTKVAELLGVPTSSILFIDDVEENIDAAIAVGMKGIVYRSVEDLQSCMKNLE